MDELDAEPTVEELSKAVDSLASGKTLDNDWFPSLSEVLQYYSLSRLVWDHVPMLAGGWSIAGYNGHHDLS